VNPTPWLLPEAAEVAKLHSMLLVELKAPPKEGCVESALGAAVSAGVYAVEDPADTDLICLSAHTLYYLARNQCFTDGNKRAAWGALVRILDLNGIRIVADQIEAADFTNAVADKKRDVAEIMTWLLEPGRLVATQSTEPPT